jgi:hypothetical protein
MKAVLDLISMYSEINQQIIDDNLDTAGINNHFR